jgi:hypothetical protein
VRVVEILGPHPVLPLLHVEVEDYIRLSTTRGLALHTGGFRLPGDYNPPRHAAPAPKDHALVHDEEGARGERGVPHAVAPVHPLTHRGERFGCRAGLGGVRGELEHGVRHLEVAERHDVAVVVEALLVGLVGRSPIRAAVAGARVG